MGKASRKFSPKTPLSRNDVEIPEAKWRLSDWYSNEDIWEWYWKINRTKCFPSEKKSWLGKAMYQDQFFLFPPCCWCFFFLDDRGLESLGWRCFSSIVFCIRWCSQKRKKICEYWNTCDIDLADVLNTKCFCPFSDYHDRRKCRKYHETLLSDHEKGKSHLRNRAWWCKWPIPEMFKSFFLCSL